MSWTNRSVLFDLDMASSRKMRCKEVLQAWAIHSPTYLKYRFEKEKVILIAFPFLSIKKYRNSVMIKKKLANADKKRLSRVNAENEDRRLITAGLSLHSVRSLSYNHYGVAITLTLSNRTPSESLLNWERNRTAKLGLLLAAAGQLMVRVYQTL